MLKKKMEKKMPQNVANEIPWVVKDEVNRKN